MTGEITHARRVAEQLGILFVETRVPVIVVRPDGAFVSANDAAIAQYGYTLEELLDMRIQDFQAHDRPIDEDLRRATVGDPMPLARRPHRRRGGEIVWVVPTATPVTLFGEVLIVSVLQDVTAIIAAEERVRERIDASRRDHQLVLHAIMAMLGERELEPALDQLATWFARGVGSAATIWLPEAEGARVLRRVAERDVPHPVAEPGGAPTLAGRALDLAREHFGRIAWERGTGYVVHPEETTPGGIEHEVFSRMAGQVIVAPLMGRDGPHGLLYGVAKDEDDAPRALAMATTLGTFGGMIFEAVQLEARAQVTWQAAAERLTDGIALLDASLRVVRVNGAECALLGKEAHEIVGRRCDEVFVRCGQTSPCAHRVALDERRRIVQESLATASGRPLRNEIIPAHLSASGIALLHVTHDLTEERAIRSQLVTNDRLATIGRLAAGVAHEINNPAAFVTVNLGVLRERLLAGDVRPTEALTMIEESMSGMDRIREIVRDLKGFARERSIDLVDVAAVAQSAIRMAAHETRGRARVERQADEGAFVRVRGARLAQVVLNLVVNAAQAIPAGNPAENRITVRTRRDGDKVRIEVADTGAGVDPAVAARIFEPFFTTREQSGGTGLGLWIARGIVEEEGGTLTFGDEPGGGACFVVELPAADPASDTWRRDSVRIPAARGAG